MRLMPERLAVCRLAPQANTPAWVGGEFYSIARTADELSIVCAETSVPRDVRSEAGWRAFQLKGPIPFTMTGVLAAVAGPLATEGIGIFAISTFDTDYVLVKESDAPRAAAALGAAGHEVEGVI